MSFDEEWITGGKYFKTWKTYAVAAVCTGTTPATAEEKEKRIWRFTACFGKDEFIGICDDSKEARQVCLDHHQSGNP